MLRGLLGRHQRQDVRPLTILSQHDICHTLAPTRSQDSLRSTTSLRDPWYEGMEVCTGTYRYRAKPGTTDAEQIFFESSHLATFSTAIDALQLIKTLVVDRLRVRVGADRCRPPLRYIVL